MAKTTKKTAAKTAKKTASKKATPKTRAAKRTAKTAYRLDYDTMGGADLFTYTCAVMLFLGMLGPRAKGKANRKDLARFYNSPTIIAHHTGNDNFARPDSKTVALTSKGKAHFGGRFDEESRQFVERKEAAQLAKALKSGNDKDLPDVWQGVYKLRAIEIVG